MKKSIYLFSFLAVALFSSCEKSDDLITDTPSQVNNIQINNNPEFLNKRLDYSNSGVISITKGTSKNQKTTSSGDDNFPLVQIAEVNPPTDNYGRVLQASHVTVNGNYAYVAYTMIGNDYSGAIDVIDISDPYKPRLVTSALVANTDLTSLTYSNGNLIIAGATDIDKNGALTSPSIAINMQLDSGLLTDRITTNNLEGNVTTDIIANSTSSFATTGNQGSLYKIDNYSKQIIGKTKLEDLRSVAISGDKIVTLSGTKGINIYNESSLALHKSFSTSTDISDSKRTIDFDGQKLLVAEGYNGLGVYDINTGLKSQTITLSNAGGDNVTNAVSVNDGYAFIANGAAGLNVYKSGTQLSLVGTVGIGGSSNYVKSSGDFIFVASGKGGLKIIKMEKIITTPSISCTGLPTFTGDSNLNVNSGQDLGYSGTTALNWVNVNASLTLCGSTTIQNDLNINSSGNLKIYGTLVQGKYQQAYPTNMNINGELQIEGSVIIWGNLTMNSGAKLTFLGNNSSITIYGKVTKNSGISITGTYTDTENKLK